MPLVMCVHTSKVHAHAKHQSPNVGTAPTGHGTLEDLTSPRVLYDVRAVS